MADTLVMDPDEFMKKFGTQTAPQSAAPQGASPKDAPVMDPDTFIQHYGPSAPTIQSSAPEVPSKSQTGLAVDPDEFMQKYGPQNIVAPENNKYLRPEMMQDPELNAALERHYAAKGTTFQSPDDMFSEYFSDMRFLDNNVAYAGHYLADVMGAKSRGDTVYLQDIKTMRDNWAKKSSVFQEDSESGVWGGIAANVIRGVLDPTSLLYFVPGLAEGKIALSQGTKFATTLALDAAVGGGLNALQQGIEKNVGIRDDISGQDILSSAALGAVPGLVLKGGSAAIKAGKVLTDTFNTSHDLAMRGPLPQAYLNNIKSIHDVPDAINNIHVQHSENGGVPIVLRSNDDLHKVFTDPNTGDPLVFGNSTSAAQGAAQVLTPNVQMNANQLGLLQSDPEKFFADRSNPTGYHLSEQRFSSEEDAKQFIKDHGNAFGGNNPSKYTMFDQNTRVENSWWGKLGARWDLTMQRYMDEMIAPKKLVEEGRGLIEQKLAGGTLSKDVADNYKALLADNPATIAINGQNANVISASFMAGKPIALVPDPNNPLVKSYTYLSGEKSLIDIANEMHQKFISNGVDDYNGMLKEFGGYVLGKRILDKEAKGTPTGMILSDVKDFMTGIQNDPLRYSAYEQGATDLRRLNEIYIQFMVAHDAMSSEHATNLLKDGDYLPFVRLYDDSKLFFSANKGQAAATFRKGMSVADKAKGQDLLDPIEAFAQHMSAGIRSAVDNRAQLQMYDWMRAAGEPFMNKYVQKVNGPVEKQMVSIDNIKRTLEGVLGPGSVQINVNANTAPAVALWVRRAILSSSKDNYDFVLRDGKFEFYKTVDPIWTDYVKGSGYDSANAVMRAADNMDLMNGAVKGWAAFNNLFAKMWVENPVWNTLKALPADALTAWLFKPELASTLKTHLLDMPGMNAINGMTKSMGDKDYMEFLVNGGGMSGLKAGLQYGYKNKIMEAAIRMGVDPEKLMGLGFDHDVGVMKRMTEAAFGRSGLAAWSNRVETAVRRNTYEGYIRDGYTRADAARKSAESTVDFRTQGSDKGAMSKQRALASFTRPMLNGLYQAGKRYIPLPGVHDVTGGERAVYWAKLAAATALPTFVYETMMDSDPYYEGLPDAYKDRWFMIPANMKDGSEGYIHVPKYPEQAFLSNFTRYFFQEMRRSEEGQNVWKLMVGHTLDSLTVASRFDDPYGNLPAPMAALLNIEGNTTQGHALEAQNQQGISGEAQGDIRNFGGYKFLDSDEARNILGQINGQFGSNFSPADVPILFNGVLSGATQYIMSAADFAYKNEKGVYQFDYRNLPWLNYVYDPARPIRFTSQEERLNDYEKRVLRLTNDLAAGKNQGKIYAITDAINYLSQQNQPKYQNYLAAAKAIQDTQKLKQQYMKQITQFYNLNTQHMPDKEFNDQLDTLFDAKNKAIQPSVEAIKGLLRTPTKLEEQTDAFSK